MHLSIHPPPPPHTHTLHSRVVRTILQHITKALGQRPQVSDHGVVVVTHTVALHPPTINGQEAIAGNARTQQMPTQSYWVLHIAANIIMLAGEV